MTELKRTDYPMFVLLMCEVDADDWHVIRAFDPDQKELAEELAEDYLARLRDGTQIGVGEVRAYGIVDKFRQA